MKPHCIWQRACCDCNPSMRTLTSCASAIYCKIHCISVGRQVWSGCGCSGSTCPILLFCVAFTFTGVKSSVCVLFLWSLFLKSWDMLQIFCFVVLYKPHILYQIYCSCCNGKLTKVHRLYKKITYDPKFWVWSFLGRLVKETSTEKGYVLRLVERM